MSVSHLLENGLGYAVALLVVTLIMITCVDVIGRYLFNAPLQGAFELTQIMLAALIFTALPLTTARGEHVEVDLLEGLFKGRIGSLLSIATALFTAAVLLTFAWRLTAHSAMIGSDGLTTTALRIPLAPFGYLAAFSCAISAVAAIMRPFRSGPSDGDSKKAGNTQ